jgi:hypothetical protein
LRTGPLYSLLANSRLGRESQEHDEACEDRSLVRSVVLAGIDLADRASGLADGVAESLCQGLALVVGELRFPVFSTTPSVSVQIISSISAVPMLVKTVKIAEIPGSAGPTGTQIVVEAETIIEAPAAGFYYANVVVTGVPAIPPATSKAAELIH